MAKVNIGELSSEIQKELDKYGEDVSVRLKLAVKEAGKLAGEEIKANAPKAKGDYAKSWGLKVVREDSSHIEVSVHSKKRYYLAHLLEYGHAKAGGGRVSGKSHIKGAEDKAAEFLDQKLKEVL